MSDSAHAGKAVRCSSVLTDDDGEPITEEHDVQDPNAPDGATVEVEQRCDTELNFTDHGRFVSSPRGEARDRFEAAALKFTCPECGGVTYMCPICSEPPDSDDNSPAGWFRGESTGEQIPCHNCNQREIQERRRHHGHSGTMGSRRRRGNGDEDLPPEAFL